MLTLPLNPDDFKWPFNGMLSDLRTAISGKANLLTALGLLVYTEILGRELLRFQGAKGRQRAQAFSYFAETYMVCRRPNKYTNTTGMG